MTEPLLNAPPPDEDIEDVPNDDAGDDPIPGLLEDAERDRQIVREWAGTLPDDPDAAAEAEFLRPIGGGL